MSPSAGAPLGPVTASMLPAALPVALTSHRRGHFDSFQGASLTVIHGVQDAWQLWQTSVRVESSSGV